MGDHEPGLCFLVPFLQVELPAARKVDVWLDRALVAVRHRAERAREAGALQEVYSATLFVPG